MCFETLKIILPFSRCSFWPSAIFRRRLFQESFCARVVKGKAKIKKEDIEKSLPFKIKEDSVEGLSESIEKIENQMYAYAKEMEFEKAAQCRDKMKSLKRKLIDL